MNLNAQIRLGIDFGGTKIEGAALDPSGNTLCSKRVPTPRHDYAGSIQAIHQLVSDLEKQLGVSNLPVGIGTPGAASTRTGLMKNSNSAWLLKKNFLQDLSNALGPRVRIANDANCFTLSEATDGAAAEARVVFGVILGTGCGGGICIEKQLISGQNAVTGEWGHNPLPWMTKEEFESAELCYCGKRGCIETFVSGVGLSRDFFRLSKKELRGEEIVRLALEQKDNIALESLARLEDRLARSLATIINVLDPDTIVLGGGLSKLERLYNNVPELWSSHVFSDEVDTKLVRAKFGDASGVRGAAWLWPHAQV